MTQSEVVKLLTSKQLAVLRRLVKAELNKVKDMVRSSEGVTSRALLTRKMDLQDLYDILQEDRRGYGRKSNTG